MDGEQFKLIDTAIGLIFIFLITSILVTTTVELISAVLRLRSVNLVQGLIWIMGEQPNPNAPAPGWRSKLAGLLIGHSKVNAKATPVVGNEAAAAPDASLTAQILRHPLIDNLAVGDRVASRIDPQLFASVLVSVLNDAKNNRSPFNDVNDAFNDIGKLVSTINNDALRRSLTPVVAKAQASVATAQDKAKATAAALAEWYDQSMAQASDWYKTRIQALTLATAVVVVVAGNIDGMRIVGALWNDAGLRQTFAAQAAAAVADPNFIKSACPGKEGVDALKCNVAAAQQTYVQLNHVPIGWRLDDYAGSSWTDGLQKLLLHVPGWILSVAAASLGAPFWFGLLQKLTPLRAAVKPDDKDGK